MVGLLSDGELLMFDTPQNLRRAAFDGEVIDVEVRQHAIPEQIARLRDSPLVIGDDRAGRRRHAAHRRPRCRRSAHATCSSDSMPSGSNSSKRPSTSSTTTRRSSGSSNGTATRWSERRHEDPSRTDRSGRSRPDSRRDGPAVDTGRRRRDAADRAEPTRRPDERADAVGRPTRSPSRDPPRWIRSCRRSCVARTGRGAGRSARRRSSARNSPRSCASRVCSSCSSSDRSCCCCCSAPGYSQNTIRLHTLFVGRAGIDLRRDAEHVERPAGRVRRQRGLRQRQGRGAALPRRR